MNDLISRQEAIDAVSDCGICIQRILDLPSVQPKQKHGRWVKYKNWYACSECGNEMFFAGTYDESQHYCYNCGARMEEGKDDE